MGVIPQRSMALKVEALTPHRNDPLGVRSEYNLTHVIDLVVRAAFATWVVPPTDLPEMR